MTSPTVRKTPRQFSPAAAERYRSCRALAFHLAKRYAKIDRRIPLDDLNGEALSKLGIAAEQFDDRRGVKFSTYAHVAIRRRLQRVITQYRGKLGGRGVQIDDEALPACRRQADPATLASNRELVLMVEKILPARWFELLRQLHLEGRTMPEVAAEFGVSTTRVKQIASKVAKACRKALRRSFPPSVA